MAETTPTANPDKPFYISKTALWAAILFVSGFVPQLKEFLVSDPEIAGVVAGIVTLALRLLTKGRVTLT